MMLLSLAVLLVVLSSGPASAYVSGQLPATKAPNDGLQKNKCHDRSSDDSGSYHLYCKEPRTKCLPPGADPKFGVEVFYESPFVNKTSSFEEIDQYVEQSFVPIFNILRLKSTAYSAVKKCLEIGSFFICGAFYPYCSMDRLVLPCRDVCERTKALCEEELSAFGGWPDVLACDKFPQEKWCSPYSECSSTDATTDATTDPTTDSTSDNQTTASTNQSTSALNDTDTPRTNETELSTTDECPTLQVTSDQECEKCKGKIRSRYSKGIISPKNGGEKYHFLAHLNVLNTLIDENCHVMYNVSIVTVYYQNHTIEEYVCGKSAIVATSDSTSEDCHCIAGNLISPEEYLIGGVIKDDKWLLDGGKNALIASLSDRDNKNKLKKIKRWLGTDPVCQ